MIYIYFIGALFVLGVVWADNGLDNLTKWQEFWAGILAIVLWPLLFGFYVGKVGLSWNKKEK